MREDLPLSELSDTTIISDSQDLSLSHLKPFEDSSDDELSTVYSKLSDGPTTTGTKAVDESLPKCVSTNLSSCIEDLNESDLAPNAAPSSPSTVRKAVSRDGSVVLDKHQYCYFCQKPLLKLARHMTTVHKDELVVARLLSLKNENNLEYHKELKKLK